MLVCYIYFSLPCKPFHFATGEIYVITRNALWRHFDSCFRVFRATENLSVCAIDFAISLMIMPQQRLHFRLFWRGKRNPATLLYARRLSISHQRQEVPSRGSKTNIRGARVNRTRERQHAPRGIAEIIFFAEQSDAGTPFATQFEF